MRGFDDLDAPAGRRVAVAGDHQTLERTGPVRLQRRRHGGRRLAGADDDGPPRRRGGQMRRQAQARVGGGDRGREHGPQQARRDQQACGAADFMIGQQFQRPHHGGMVPFAAATGGAGVEQLLAGRRVRQADMERLRPLQRQVEVFLVQLDAEPRIEAALHHPLAMHLQDARTGEPAHQGLTHAGRIGAGLGGEQQRLAHRLDGQRHDDLVGDLGGLAVAVAADQGDVAAHLLEQRPHPLERRLGAAHHDGQRGLARADLAAGDRRIQVVAAERVDAAGELLGRDRRDGAHVHHHAAGGEALGDAVRAEQHGFDMRRVRHHQDDDVGLGGDLAARPAGDGTGIEQFLRQGAGAVQEQRVAGGLQVPRHRPPHDAEPDESDLAHAVSPLPGAGPALSPPIAARMRATRLLLPAARMPTSLPIAT